MDVAEFKESQRRMWEAGDYPPVGQLIEPGAFRLVTEAGVGPGERVLDVGCGSGSVAIAAARSGADVVAIDITDAWFEAARERAVESGVTIDFRIGDAEAIPFDDDGFDIVLSSFAAIFAPDHAAVARELVRVCRPGGTIGLTAWTAEGVTNKTLETLARFMPDPPDFVTPSIRWGDPAHVRELFESYGVDLRFSLPSFPIEFTSIDAFEAFAFENSGGMISARQALESMGKWDEARALMRNALEESNEAGDGSYRATWEYLLILGTTPPTSTS